MTVVDKPTHNHTFTVADLMNLAADKEYELRRGELVEMPGPSYKHGVIVTRLDRYLDTFVSEQQLGQVLSNTAFVLDQQNALRPDVAFVLKARLVGLDVNDAFPGPPDLAIEVVSRTDVVFEVDDKVADYLKAGVQQVWVVNPRSQLVFVYLPNADKPLILGSHDDIEGGALLPGFSLKVSILFA
jgi:Uma2 family endonuclease